MIVGGLIGALITKIQEQTANMAAELEDDADSDSDGKVVDAGGAAEAEAKGAGAVMPIADHSTTPKATGVGGTPAGGGSML